VDNGLWKFHRRSNRLKGYDYSRPGAYFVTICLYGREPYLEMAAVRAIVNEVWNALPQRFPTIALDEFVVMPDHVHFILWLCPDAENRPTLGRIVCAYKSLIGRAALSYLRTLGDICGDHFWQRDYYDHIISKKAELREIRKYIRDNPYKQECGEASTPYEGGANTRPKIETYRSHRL
jgi:putative transposase